MDFLQILIHVFSEYGYSSVFITLILCGLGIPVPEDIALVSGGVISSFGKANVHVMFFVGMSGVLIGDLIIYNCGRHFAPTILKNKIMAKLLGEHRFEWIQEKYEKWGSRVVFFGRFMPGLRMPIFFLAGMSRKISPAAFFMIDFTAAIISVPIWVYMGFYLGQKHDLMMEWIHKSQLFIFIVIGTVLLFMYLKYYINKKIHIASQKQKFNPASNIVKPAE